MAFCFLPDLVEDTDILKYTIYRIGRFSVDMQIIDEAFLNNLFNYTLVQLDECIPEEHKKYLIDNIDKYIRPRENKYYLDIDRFAAACLVFRLSYQNDFAKRDEARALASHIFKFGETELRNSTDQLIEAYQNHIIVNNKVSQIEDNLLHALLLMRLSDKLSETSFEEKFSVYQKHISSKKLETTQKTYEGYLLLKRYIYTQVQPYLIDDKLQANKISEIFSIAPPNAPYIASENKEPEDMSEQELYDLFMFLDIQSMATPPHRVSVGVHRHIAPLCTHYRLTRLNK
jgi:hypothetical protein